MGWAMFISWRRGTRLVDQDRIYSLKEKLELLPRLLPFIAVIVGVVYALYGGIATPSEAAGVGAMLCLLMVVVIAVVMVGYLLLQRRATRWSAR